MEKRAARNSPEIIERIKRLAEGRRYNPSSFGLALGKTRSWGHQFMKNEILMSADTLQKIAKLLGVTVEFLLTGSAEDIKTEFREMVREIVREEMAKKAEPRK